MNGKVWKFGECIDTDVIAPAKYIRLEPEEYSQYMMKPLMPEFAKKVSYGDYIVGGENFGMGSSREQAVLGLQILGIKGVIAKSFGRVFFRNAINRGLPVLIFKEKRDYNRLVTGDFIELDFINGIIINKITKEQIHTNRMPSFLCDILKEGGAIKYYNKFKTVD
jgi:3-isopropylmalate dehydratase small subunit